MTDPRLVEDMPDVEYHAHPALSATQMKQLIKAPAIYRWWKDNPPEHKDHFDFGKAAHRRVLGVGEAVRVLDFKDWRTKAAQEAKAKAYADGVVPILAADDERIEAMAQALREHPVARYLFQPGEGRAELSAFWTDEETGIELRCRFDWMPNPVEGRRLIVSDLKTAASSEPDPWLRSAANFGYAIQQEQYLEGVRATGLGDPDSRYVFAVVEKEPPYLVTVVQLDEDAERIGRHLRREAISRLVECTKSGHWPGYSDDVVQGSLPAYYVNQFEGVI